MEEIINGRSKLPADAVYLFKVGDTCTTYRFCRSKCHKQGFFAPGPDARNFVERINANRFRTPRAVGADSKTVSFIPEPLDIVQDGIAGIEHEGLLAGDIEMLPAGVAVQSLCYAGDRKPVQAQILQNGPDCRYLPLAAIDQDQIGAELGFGLGCRLSFRLLLEQPGEAAGEHLAHHAEIIAKRARFAAHVEFAVLVFDEAFGPRDDHGTHGLGTLDVGIVEDLDPPGPGVQTEDPCDAVEQPRLRLRFSEPAAECLLGIGKGMIDERAFFTALRHKNLDAPSGTGAESLRKQVLFFDRMGEEDEWGQGLVVIELGEERAEDFGLGEAFIGTGKIGAIAPVLTCAEEEYLDAGVAGLLCDGEEVGFVHCFRVDALNRSDHAHGGNAIAVARGQFEIELVGSLLHLRGKPFLHYGAAAAKKVLGLLDKSSIGGLVDFPRTGGRAALDLEEKAGPRAIFENRIAAGAQQKGFLKRVDGAVHGPGGSEGPEIAALAASGTAMFGKLRHAMVAGYEDIGERFVIAKNDIVAGLVLLDEVCLKQECFGFGLGRYEFHIGGGSDHSCDAAGVAAEAGIVHDPIAQHARLAHINHVALGVDHAVDAWPVGQHPAETANDVGARRRKVGRRLLVKALIVGLSGHDHGQMGVTGAPVQSLSRYLTSCSARYRCPAGWRRRSISTPTLRALGMMSGFSTRTRAANTRSSARQASAMRSAKVSAR